MCILCFTFSWREFFSPFFVTFFFSTLQWALFIHFIPFCFPSVNSPPVVPHSVLSTLISYSLFLQLTQLSFCLRSCSSSPSFSPFIILTSFIPNCLSHPFISLLFFPLPMFSVSVEPLWLHRYSDCWLCRRGGMLFRHSTRRYCTPCTLTQTTKITLLQKKTSPCTGSILYWGCTCTFWVPTEMCQYNADIYGF